MSKQPRGKGAAFFERAEKVAETGNFDYAIDMYLQGLAREPENVEHGHKPLRAIGMQRLAAGGKPANMIEKLKRRNAKTPEDALANALFLLSKEPGAPDQLEAAMKAANKLKLTEVGLFYTSLLFDTQKVAADKADKRILIEIVESLSALGDFNRALEAAQLAKKVAPNDGAVSDLARNTAAQVAIKQGQYDKKDRETGFEGNVKDMTKQKQLIEKDSDVKSLEYLNAEIERTRSEYLTNPTMPGKINAYIDTILAFEDDQHEDQAIAVLHEVYDTTKTYRYKMRIGDIRIRQMTRKWRELKAAGDESGALQLARQQLAFELEEFAERVVNYPTDLSMKYELGRRQFLAGRFDDAIGSMQVAQNDPRRRLKALAILGQAFSKKGLKQEAVDTFRRALEGDVREADQKDLRYFLGDALEAIGDLQGAAAQFSLVAQMDYQYKDASKRLENLRKGNE
jgi:tetratricopeptide (TPR) repeat protein